ALTNGSPKAVHEAKAMLQTLAEIGGEFNSLNEHLWRIRGTYNDLKLDYENALKDVTKQLTYENVITHAFPADKKAYPIRWVIVTVAMLSSLFLAFLILLFVEKQDKV